MLKSQVVLLEHLLLDAGDVLGFSTKRDIITLQRRYEHEGEAFLSIALPRLDDLLLTGLETGLLPPCEGWKAQGRLPLFLHGAWRLIFDEDGTLKPSPNTDAILVIRQISRAFKKVFEVCSHERVTEAIERFIDVDRSLEEISKSSFDPMLSVVAHYLFGEVVGRSISSNLIGRNGPGSVSERHGTNSRWNFESIGTRVESHLGAEFYRPTWSDLELRYPEIQEIPARLEAVPKTAEKPRLISIEPSYNQFAQQALHGPLQENLERLGTACSYESQQPNQEMAFQSSIDRSLATIDLSDASDRVSLPLVREVFAWSKPFLDFLHATRSCFLELPDGRIHVIRKFASMGSAMTFPIESMVFLAIVTTAICRAEGTFDRFAVRRIARRSNGVSVYGDDIVIPSRYFPQVVSALETHGLKVNVKKSFVNGFFRESCGTDAYKGQNVTPIYVRRHFPTQRSDSEELVSTSSLRNQLYSTRLWPRAVRYLDQIIGSVIAYPSIPEGMDAIGRWHPNPDPTNSRWNENLYRREWKVPTLRFTRREDPATPHGALFKCLTTGLIEDSDHLEFDGRPVTSRIHNRWRAES